PCVVRIERGTKNFIVFPQVWPGSGYAHIAEQDVDELRHFIKTCFPKEPAKRVNAFVVRTCLPSDRSVPDMHSAELEDMEGRLRESRSRLLVEDGARSLFSLKKPNQQGEGRENKCDNRQGDRQIERSFECPINRILQRLIVEGEKR